MKKQDIIRAWRDEEFLLSLSEQERNQLPESPAGVIDVGDDDLRGVGGGGSQHTCDPDDLTCNVATTTCSVPCTNTSVLTIGLGGGCFSC